MSALTPVRTEVITQDNGIVKEVLVEGVGDCPNVGDEVTAHYTGRLASNGEIFDSSVSRGTPFKFTLGRGQVIKLWDQGFATMRKGEKAILIGDAKYCYGQAGSPPKIPGGAQLRFEVELLGFGPKPKEVWQMSPEEKIAHAEAKKAEGNAAFTSGQLYAAIEAYSAGSQALSQLLDATVADDKRSAVNALRVTLRSNAAQAQLKARNYTEAVKEADEGLKVDPKHPKCLFRKGSALLALGKIEAARTVLMAAAKAAPGDAPVRAELEKAKKMEAAAAAKEKAAFGGIFNRGLRLSEDDSAAPAAAASAAAPEVLPAAAE